MTNPLLDWGGATPPWDAIRPDHLEAAVDAVLADNRREIEALLDNPTPTWDTLIAPMEALDNRLQQAFGPGGHLHGVLNTPEWRDAYEACLPKLTDYSSELGQNTRLYEATLAVSRQDGLDSAQRATLEHSLRDFKLSGVALDDAAKERFRAIQQRLAELGNSFDRHVVDATDAWQLHVTDEAELDGIPQAARNRARHKAEQREQDGWLFGLDFPSYDAVITHAHNRHLRERMYEAFSTRASDQGPDAGRFDNTALMAEILDLRHEEAQLLGYANFAEVSCVSKMAESPDAIETFLLELAEKARPHALVELADLQALARDQDGLDTLQPWDVPYYAEQLREQRYELSDEALRPYFAIDKVLEGLFDVAARLFGIRVQADADHPVWHPDAHSYRVLDANGQQIAWFFLDPYAREQKRSGAWMDDCAGRLAGPDGVQLPVAMLVCNFTPPHGDDPALLTHDEVQTLFHEFGHALQHMLTEVDYLSVSGINGVAWDAVELPSQFMENWCWEQQSLDLFARHYQTGATIPAEWVRSIRASRVFNAGLATLRQVEFALFDLRLHRDYTPGDTDAVLRTAQQVREQVAVIKPPLWHRFPHSFGHIFAGGYAAGYYSYKWAEVLSADAFDAFLEHGIFDPDTGRRFREAILATGGSADPMELFKRFRGREPSIEPLLKQEGLLAA